MTWKDFVCLDWHFMSHIALADKHQTVRVAGANGHSFAVCSHCPTEEYKELHPYAHQYEHYKVDGVVYKSRKKLEEALEKI